MSFATRTAIQKCLQLEYRDQAANADGISEPSGSVKKGARPVERRRQNRAGLLPE